MAWFEDFLDGCGGDPAKEGVLKCLSFSGPCMLFERREGAFHLVEEMGYSSGFQYAFLKSEGERLSPLLSRGWLSLPESFSQSGASPVWLAVDRPGDPRYLLVVELPVSEEASEGVGLLLRYLIRLESERRSRRSGSERGLASPNGEVEIDLPVWLRDLLPSLVRSSSPFLLVAESGSGVDELVLALMKEKFGSPERGIFFHPARLSEGVQLRELFGEGAGRGSGSRSAVPVVERPEEVVVIQEAGDLAELVQLRLLALFTAKEQHQSWIFETTRNLGAMVEAGRFEEGLYRILKEGEVVIPPVRAFRDRIVEEAERLIVGFRRQYRRDIELAEDVRDLLVRYEWPGNWRELKSTLESAFLMCSDNIIRKEDVRVGQGDQGEDSDDLNLRKRTRELEKRVLLRAYALHGGNQVQMARALGISRGSLQYKLEKYGMI